MEDIPKITTPIEADSQYKLVVKLSEVIFQNLIGIALENF